MLRLGRNGKGRKRRHFRRLCWPHSRLLWCLLRRLWSWLWRVCLAPSFNGSVVRHPQPFPHPNVIVKRSSHAFMYPCLAVSSVQPFYHFTFQSIYGKSHCTTGWRMNVHTMIPKPINVITIAPRMMPNIMQSRKTTRNPLLREVAQRTAATPAQTERNTTQDPTTLSVEVSRAISRPCCALIVAENTPTKMPIDHAATIMKMTMKYANASAMLPFRTARLLRSVFIIGDDEEEWGDGLWRGGVSMLVPEPFWK